MESNISPDEARPVAGKGTRNRILDLAESLLLDKGFNGFSYKHIAEQLGVKNAAIHYHFPAKSDLGTALVQRYRRRFSKWIAQQQEKSLSPTEKLSGYFGITVSYLRHGGKVCPLGILETEFNVLPVVVRDEAQALDTEMREWLSVVLEDGRASGEFVFDGEAKGKSLVITASLQGVLQIARAAGPEVVFTTVRQLKKDLGI
jgi:TetR/AcrR family transcriptional repressor of nem operon